MGLYRLIAQHKVCASSALNKNYNWLIRGARDPPLQNARIVCNIIAALRHQGIHSSAEIDLSGAESSYTHTHSRNQ